MKHPAYLVLAIFLTATPAISGQLYRWVDKDGTVNISNTPPPENQTTIKTYNVTTTIPPSAKSANQDRASRELEEMQIGFRARARRSDMVQFQLQLKLLEAQGQPADSHEAYKLKQAFKENLYNQAMQREGMERITILEECQDFLVKHMTSAVYEYPRRR